MFNEISMAVSNIHFPIYIRMILKLELETGKEKGSKAILVLCFYQALKPLLQK